ncbi:acyl-CoA thioesterase [Rubripirellula reticaptiva]|nr:thioesterase family protein [Rubripirellula reticaptiva]
MFTVQRRVEFRDTDAAGIVHFSAFFPMMESAEHEMLRSMGISVFPKSAPNEHPLSWPRVSASCDYLSAAQFEDLLRIDVHVAQIGNSSVTYRFKFTRDEVVVAEGSLTVVCCLLTPKGLSKTPIPAELRELFQKHL